MMKIQEISMPMYSWITNRVQWSITLQTRSLVQTSNCRQYIKEFAQFMILPTHLKEEILVETIRNREDIEGILE